MKKQYTSFELRDMIRDHTTLTGAQRILLDEIARRANPKHNYACWPSMSLLIHDTHYGDQQIRNAARSLEEAGFIKRIVKSYQDKQKRWRKETRYFLNVHKLEQLSEERQGPTAVPDAHDDPFGLNGEASSVEGNLLHAPCETITGLVDVFQQMWPEHTHPADEKPAIDLRQDLEACVEAAQSAARFGQVMHWVYDTDKDTVAAISASDRPGALMFKKLPQWLVEVEDRLLPAGSSSLALCADRECAAVAV